MIVIPALHPAYDRIVFVDALTPGAVHRPSRTLTGLGSKPVNVARFCAAMGLPVRLPILADRRLLAVAAADPLLAGPLVSMHPIHSPVAGRTDVTIVDRAGHATVFNEAASDPGREVTDAVVAETLDRLADGDTLVLAGSAPDAMTGVIRHLAEAGRACGAFVIVDASGPWLREGLAAQPSAVKISAAEAAALEDQGARYRVGGRPAALASIGQVGITDGERGLRAWVDGTGPFLVEPPAGLEVVNPLGAGDAVTAGLAVARAQGLSPLDGFILGTAMASARLRHLEVRLDAADVEPMRRRVKVTPPN